MLDYLYLFDNTINTKINLRHFWKQFLMVLYIIVIEGNNCIGLFKAAVPNLSGAVTP